LRDAQIKMDYSQRMQTVQDPAQRQQLAQEAQGRQIQAVKADGLWVQQYNQVIQIAQADPGLKQRVLAAADAQRGTHASSGVAGQLIGSGGCLPDAAPHNTNPFMRETNSRPSGARRSSRTVAVSRSPSVVSSLDGKVIALRLSDARGQSVLRRCRRTSQQAPHP
jgi:Domain of unknown function (DUF4168)